MFIIPEFNTSQADKVETYRGNVKSLNDALLVLEGTRLGLLPKIKRRLNGVERKYIAANTVFAWNETECGMKRWTDGKNWSASKVSGPFLTYKELDANKNIKPKGLVKQSFSLVTKQNHKLHLISYIAPHQPASKTPSSDPKLNKLSLDPNTYHERLLNYDLEREKLHGNKRALVSSNSAPNTRSSSIDSRSDLAVTPRRPASARATINSLINENDPIDSPPSVSVPTSDTFAPKISTNNHKSIYGSLPIPRVGSASSDSEVPSKRIRLSPTMSTGSIPKPKSPFPTQPSLQIHPSFTLAGPKGFLGLSGYQSYHHSNSATLPSSPTYGTMSMQTSLLPAYQAKPASHYMNLSSTKSTTHAGNTIPSISPISYGRHLYSYNSSDNQALNVLDKGFSVQ